MSPQLQHHHVRHSLPKHVMRAAAENLVPVTLELGGKSPVVISKNFDIATAIERTLTIKTFNAGQICLSPDYMMVPHDQVEQLAGLAKNFVATAFPSIANSPDYTSIISQRHVQRLTALLADAEAKGAQIINLAPAGEPAFSAASRKFAPHLIMNVTDNMQIMQEEIFGPLLPVQATYVHDFSVMFYAKGAGGFAKFGTGHVSTAAMMKGNTELEPVVPAPVSFWIARVDQAKAVRPVKYLQGEDPGYTLALMDGPDSLLAIDDIVIGKTMQFNVRYKEDRFDVVNQFSAPLSAEEAVSYRACLAGISERLKSQ